MSLEVGTLQNNYEVLKTAQKVINAEINVAGLLQAIKKNNSQSQSLSSGAPKLKSLSQMGWMLISSGFNFKLKWSLQL